jgi:D-psicose/D-tagatose/L-ribulose 3-epimerase
MSLNVKLGVSSWLWTSPFGSEDAAGLFSKVAKMGYDFIEIAVEDPGLIHVPTIKRELANNNLSVNICGAFGPTRDLTNESSAVVQTGFDYINSCLDICAELGVSFFAGPMYSAVGKARMIPEAQRTIEWNRAVENLRKVCEEAQSRNLEIALEPLNRFESDLINNVDDVLRLIQDIDHPAAKICLDMFHMNIEEPDPEAAIIKAKDKLVHVQVSENYRGIPGTGNANWDAYYRGLNAINYQSGVAIESFTPENKELAAAVCIWRNLASDQDTFGSEGISFLKKWTKNNQ